MDSSEGYKRLDNEFESIRSHPIGNIGCTVGLPEEDNIYRWRLTFSAAKDSPYKGGMFFVEISFPKDYPNKAPQINFITPIYHPNVCPYISSLGFVCPNFIKNWNPSITAQNILTKLFALFYKVNPDSAFDKEMANEYLNNRPLYESKIQYFTRKYGNPFLCGKYELDKDWDFSCNESDLKTYCYPIEDSSEIYNKYDGNEQSFNIEFVINGNSEKVNIQCQLKEKIKDVFNRFLDKYQYKFNDEPLIIYNSNKLNMNKQVGNISSYNNVVLVIDISDLEFLK